MCWCWVVMWRRKEVGRCSVLLVQGEINFGWMGFVPVLGVQRGQIGCLELDCEWGLSEGERKLRF